MGKLATIAAFLLACAAPALAEDAIDPTVWSKDQWRSDLFSTYSSHRSAPSHSAVHRIVVEKTIIVQQADTATDAAPAPVRPKLLTIGGDRAVSVQRPGHSCDGALTLTWSGDHAVSHCNRNRQRIIRITR